MTTTNVVIQENKPSVGRQWQHAEDLVIVNGSAGARHALDVLESLASDVSDVRVKWDGSIGIYFGRDAQGEFVLTDKSGFVAKGYDGHTRSAQDLERMLLSRNKQVDADRRRYASSMAMLFGQLESIVASDFEGFVFADVLFFEQPPLNQHGEYEFTPNTVTYHIAKDSELGQQIATSQCGIVIHQHDGKPIMESVPGLDTTGSVFVISHVPVADPPRVDFAAISHARSAVDQQHEAIDSLLDDTMLRSVKLSDFKKTLYRFVNSQVTTRDLSNLNARFEPWLRTSAVSAGKQDRIMRLRETNSAGFAAVFSTLETIMCLKDHVIDELDHRNPIKQTINGEPGGEGYVRGNIKLVPRCRFTAANVEKHS